MAPPIRPRLLLPEAPALVASHGKATLLTPDGEVLTLTGAHIAEELEKHPAPYLVHAPATARRLDLPRFLDALDLLELFAFARPAHHAPPTPRGLALALDLPLPEDDEAAAALLPEIASRLLRALADEANTPSGREAAAMAAQLGQVADWPWVPSVLAALGQPEAKPSRDAFKPWRRLPDWEETAPPPPPASFAVTGADARRRLAEMLGAGAEQRPQQADFASAAANAFIPRETEGAPHMVLAEAGTGTGKTLGYIAPASLWAERNGAPVWLSTYTRNLQRQIDQELAQLFPDPEERRARVAVRKGRENYLCLLNLEETLGQSGIRNMALPLALVARWAGATRDGDISGGDFPGWIGELFAPGTLYGLGDRRGECIRSACAHYKKCFVEHSIRRARTARLVVANHALVMVQAALGGGEDGKPTRYVFDEGHHLFDAADSAFSAALTGVETAELRRWLLGAEGGRSRAKGLRARITELAGEIPELLEPMEAALHAARCLPVAGWYARMSEPGSLPEGAVTEAFLHATRRQILARAPDDDGIYTLEVDLQPVGEEVAETGSALAQALRALEQPLTLLRDRLAAKLEVPEGEDEMEVGERIRLETAMRGIERRALMPLGAWRGMLGALDAPVPEPGERPTMVDWLQLDRRDGRDVDAGLHRHWLDPTIPFAQTVAAPAHGLLVTSATLTDAAKRDDPERAWHEAEARSGALHLPLPAIRAAMPSPFDYAANTRTFVVTDVDARQPGPVASAMQQLFLASGGGGLGIFTAIRRLREVASRITPALEARGIPLYAQHVDAMDNATLVDIFRAEENSCLLGTDAMRDGVDVPGRALRLLVFDRVPWPRRTILQRERRLHLSDGDPQGYDDAHARHKLRQAFGRLVRRADDKGIFVLLDRACPSRILAGLPEGVTPQRVTLAQAVAGARELLGG
ncbi:ATP-dependent DNA helicase [Roseococcus sp. YIM B11640]|uniref:ATP-dependent DNA helicase n=1 Tax=Roseococcus sp. YIM B11640 TaxID=3133973 RepID=UPI003C7A86FC